MPSFNTQNPEGNSIVKSLWLALKSGGWEGLSRAVRQGLAWRLRRQANRLQPPPAPTPAGDLGGEKRCESGTAIDDDVEVSTRLLIVGSGPSARSFFAVRHLVQGNISTFALGGTYRFFDELGWSPDYFAWTDAKTFRSHEAEMFQRLQRLPSTSTIYLPLFASTNPEMWQQVDAKICSVRHSSTGTFALTEAVNLLFSEVGLVGIDLAYAEHPQGSRTLRQSERARFSDLVNWHDELLTYDATPKLNLNYWRDDYQQQGDVFSRPLENSHANGVIRAVAQATSAGVRVTNFSPLCNIPEAAAGRVCDLFEPVA